MFPTRGDDCSDDRPGVATGQQARQGRVPVVGAGAGGGHLLAGEVVVGGVLDLTEDADRGPVQHARVGQPGECERRRRVVGVRVVDEQGREIFTSGTRDERNFIAPGSFLFKAEPVDQHGNLIDRHNLWEMVGVRFRRSLFPGYSDRLAWQLGLIDTDLAYGESVNATFLP